MPMQDPLGLERCAVCSNAFAFEADDPASARRWQRGYSGFVCESCAAAGRDAEP